MNKEDYKEFIDRQRITHKSMAESINNTQTSKIEKIKQKKFESLKINYNEDWFINKTNIEFPEECKWMLTLGEKFIFIFYILCHKQKLFNSYFQKKIQ